jgi:hypothetical protein
MERGDDKVRSRKEKTRGTDRKDSKRESESASDSSESVERKVRRHDEFDRSSRAKKRYVRKQSDISSNTYQQIRDLNDRLNAANDVIKEFSAEEVAKREVDEAVKKEEAQVKRTLVDDFARRKVESLDIKVKVRGRGGVTGNRYSEAFMFLALLLIFGASLFGFKFTWTPSMDPDVTLDMGGNQILVVSPQHNILVIRPNWTLALVVLVVLIKCAWDFIYGVKKINYVGYKFREWYLDTIDADLRPDSGSVQDLKHEDAYLCYITHSYESKKLGFFSRIKYESMLCSAEVISQLSNQQNLNLNSAPKTVFDKLNIVASRLQTVNHDRYECFKGNYVVQNSVIVAYNMHADLVNRTKHHVFPLSLA